MKCKHNVIMTNPNLLEEKYTQNYLYLNVLSVGLISIEAEIKFL